VHRPIGVWLPHVAAPDPPGGPGPWRPFLSTLSSRGTWRHRTCKSTGGGPKTMTPTVRPGPRARSQITSRPSGWIHWQTTLWRTRPPDMQISSQRATTAFWPLSRSSATIEERQPGMWWCAFTTMRLAHTPEPGTLAGGTPVRMHRQGPCDAWPPKAPQHFEPWIRKREKKRRKKKKREKGGETRRRNKSS
jgi:hypothetical protein